MNEERFVFQGTHSSYMQLWNRLGEIGNTHQQAGEVIFQGGSPPTIRVPTGTSTDCARPGDTVVIESTHRLRVDRSEREQLDRAHEWLRTSRAQVHAFAAQIEEAERRAIALETVVRAARAMSAALVDVTLACEIYFDFEGRDESDDINAALLHAYGDQHNYRSALAALTPKEDTT